MTEESASHHLQPAVNRQPWFPQEKARREDSASLKLIGVLPIHLEKTWICLNSSQNTRKIWPTKTRAGTKNLTSRNSPKNKIPLLNTFSVHSFHDSEPWTCLNVPEKCLKTWKIIKNLKFLKNCPSMKNLGRTKTYRKQISHDLALRWLAPPLFEV